MSRINIPLPTDEIAGRYEAGDRLDNAINNLAWRTRRMNKELTRAANAASEATGLDVRCYEGGDALPADVTRYVVEVWTKSGPSGGWQVVIRQYLNRQSAFVYIEAFVVGLEAGRWVTH